MIRKSKIVLISIFLMGLLWLTGCSSPYSDFKDTNDSVSSQLVYDHSMELSYAENFTVDYYVGGYKLLKTKDGTEILTVPDGCDIPGGFDENVIILQCPVNNIYLVSSSVMDIFSKLDAMDTIRLSGQKEENWYIQDAKDAMAAGDILYAGKYNQPDYELITSENCSLAIENMMISHSPEVKEMLESFDIPVLIEYSSYESHPLGRVEWVKFFGALTDREDKAEEIFNAQLEILNNVSASDNTGKTVAFFYITSNGLVQVRQCTDYIPKMIELAGGRYIFDTLSEPDNNRSTMNMQVEEFYDGAKDADYLIYNSTIDGEISSVDDLLDKCPVLDDFKAVKNGDVWCTTNDMYQQSMSIGLMIGDFNSLLTGGDEDDMTYLFKLE